MALVMSILIGFVGGAAASLAWSEDNLSIRLLFAAAGGLAGAVVAEILALQLGWDHLGLEFGWLGSLF